MPTFAYILITEDGVDQVCETRLDANRERDDLKQMGCKVRIKKCPWENQDQVIEALEA